MTTTIVPRVEIDPELRKLSGVEAAIEAGLAYLGNHVRGVPLPGVIRWRPVPLDRHSVEVEMADDAGDGPLAASIRFPLKDLDDPVNRDIRVLRAWQGLLRERSKQNMASFRKHFRAFQEAVDRGEVSLAD